MAHVHCEHEPWPADAVAGDEESDGDGWGSDTDLASEASSQASGLECDFLAADGEFVSDFVLEAGALPSQSGDGAAPLSPRMQNIYETLGLASVAHVSSVRDAATMVQDSLGPNTEDIRAWAFRELAADRAMRPSLPVPRLASNPTASCSARCSGPVGGAHGACTTLGGCTALSCSAGGLVHSESSALSGGTSSSSVGAGLSLRLRETVDAEDAATLVAAQQLVDATPAVLLAGGPSSVPHIQRIRNRVDHLAGCGIGSIKRAISTMRAWKEFCTQHSIPDWGTECDIEMAQWFAREGRVRGKSVPHDRMEGLRWLADNLDCAPFNAAKDPRCRKATPPSLGQEPAWAEMLEVAAMVHLLRIAVLYTGAGCRFVCAWAAAGYCTTAASLRMVDGCRSPPPTECTVGGTPCLESVAALSKGRRRATMQPLPWLFPTVSPTSEFTDAEVHNGLIRALASLPPAAPSMFMGLQMGGKDASLPAVVKWSSVQWGSAKSSPSRITTGMAFLLQWAPLSLTASEARKVAAKQHTYRHVVPELSRVMAMAPAARDETGYWKEKRGRLNRKSNRYSRSAERVLQSTIRKCVLQWVRRRFTPGTRPALEHFAAGMREMVEMGEESAQWIRQADETL